MVDVVLLGGEALLVAAQARILGALVGAQPLGGGSVFAGLRQKGEASIGQASTLRSSISSGCSASILSSAASTGSSASRTMPCASRRAVFSATALARKTSSCSRRCTALVVMVSQSASGGLAK